MSRREKQHMRRLLEQAAMTPKKNLDDVLGRPEPHGNLLSGLRNINRSATRALDVAGVPDKFQGLSQDDVEHMKLVDAYNRSWGDDPDSDWEGF